MHTNGTSQPRRILMIAANPATSPVTGWPIGFWWAELTHPYWTFVEAGCEVTIASPEGGDLQGDMFSDPRHESGYSAHDFVSLGFIHSQQHIDLLKNTHSLGDISTGNYDALFFVGGQSPMVTFAENPKVHRVISEAYEAGKVVALVCHAVSALLHTRLSDGRLLVEGKRWTGFTDAEEQIAEHAVGAKLQPFWIETEARKIANTTFEVAAPFASFAIRDGNLVTGQQQNSGTAAAREVIISFSTVHA